MICVAAVRRTVCASGLALAFANSSIECPPPQKTNVSGFGCKAARRPRCWSLLYPAASFEQPNYQPHRWDEAILALRRARIARIDGPSRLVSFAGSLSAIMKTWQRTGSNELRPRNYTEVLCRTSPIEGGCAIPVFGESFFERKQCASSTQSARNAHYHWHSEQGFLFAWILRSASYLKMFS